MGELCKPFTVREKLSQMKRFAKFNLNWVLQVPIASGRRGLRINTAAIAVAVSSRAAQACEQAILSR
jgi:hypothetical protein